MRGGRNKYKYDEALGRFSLETRAAVNMSREFKPERQLAQLGREVAARRHPRLHSRDKDI
jgi:hypothetical protein